MGMLSSPSIRSADSARVVVSASKELSSGMCATCVAVCCSLLQCVAVYRTIFWYVCHGSLVCVPATNGATVIVHTAIHCDTLQHTATHIVNTHCSTPQHILQHTATHCNTLQHTSTHCNTLLHTFCFAVCMPCLVSTCDMI